MSRYQAKEELRQVYQREEKRYQAYIPAKPKVSLYGEEHVFRVCAYCRVSTENDEQLSSFELQQSHYKQLVMDHPNWELKHIYADAPVIIGLKPNPTKTGAALVLFSLFTGIFETFR